MDTIEKNPSVVERQAREIRALKARIDVLETNYQHEGQMRVEAEWKVRALAVAHIKRRLMPAAEAGALANDAGDKRYHANIDLWETRSAGSIWFLRTKKRRCGTPSTVGRMTSEENSPRRVSARRRSMRLSPRTSVTGTHMPARSGERSSGSCSG